MHDVSDLNHVMTVSARISELDTLLRFSQTTMFREYRELHDKNKTFDQLHFCS